MTHQTRKPYVAPRLSDYGHVEALTAGIKLVGVSDGVGQLTPVPMNDDDDGDAGS